MAANIYVIPEFCILIRICKVQSQFGKVWTLRTYKFILKEKNIDFDPFILIIFRRQERRNTSLDKQICHRKLYFMTKYYVSLPQIRLTANTQIFSGKIFLGLPKDIQLYIYLHINR